MASENEGRTETSIGALVGKTVEQGKELLQLEMERTKEELRGQAHEALVGAVLVGSAGLLALGGLAALTLAAARALLERPGRAALLGVGLLGGAALLLVAGLEEVPEHPLEDLRDFARREAGQLTEKLSS